MKQLKTGTTPWYFGPYVVFANDSSNAHKIYEEAVRTRDDSAEKTGGAVVLPNGEEGYWELMSSGEGQDEATVRHSGR